MPATQLTAQTYTGDYPANGLALAFASGDATNGNVFRPTGNDLLIMGGIGTVTLNGVPDLQNRTGTLSIVLTSGELAVWLCDQIAGWNGANGVSISSSAATTKLAVVRLR